MSYRVLRCAAVFLFCMLGVLLAAAQQAKLGVLTSSELKQAVPSVYFFRGQSATVQVRNSGGIRLDGGKLVLAALVDTSGYSADVSAKYQGLLITEVKLNFEDSALNPGQYGFGFKDGKFLVMDVGANDLFSLSTKTDDALKRPVPLKVVEEGGEYRLYAGKKWVALKPE